MKTRILLTLLFPFMFMTLKAQQVTISGPTEVCAGECYQYYFTAQSPSTSSYIWWIINADYTITPNNGAYVCFFEPGTYTLGVFDEELQFIVAEMTVTVANSSTPPEIIALSEAYCSNEDQNGNITCDQVCAFSTVTYTTPVSSPGANIDWQVNGAESYTENGSNVTVEWGEAGTGEVNVTVQGGSNGGYSIQCGLTDYASTANSEDGGAFVYLDGPNTAHTVTITGWNGFTQSITSTGVTTYFNELPVGNYSIEVIISSTGETLGCNFSIVEVDPSGFCDVPIVAFVATTPTSNCNACDGSAVATVSGGVPPYTYTWSNGVTSTVNTGLCPGVYEMIVTDGNGCTASVNFTVGCETSSCQATNSICVDILEIPNAAFTTTPAAVNGVVEICEGQTIFFENQSSGATIYTWDFGNSVSSSEVDVAYTYPSPGTYQALLIARNECYCSDSTSITVIVEDAISPEIDCAGTVCPGEEVTYSTDADCGTFHWTISGNGTVVSGGEPSDDYITINWGAGPEGLIELLVDDCSGDFCITPLFELIPIIDDNAEIEGPEKVCRSQETSYSITPFAGTSFSWSNSAMGSITSGQSTNEITVQWSDLLSTSTQWVAVEYDNCYLGCGGRDTIWIDILSEFFLEGPIEACPDGFSIFEAKDIVNPSANTPVHWTVLDETGTILEQSVSPTNTYNVNWTYGPGTYTVQGEIANPDDYCVEQYSIFIKVVDPTIAPSGIDGETEICPGETYTYEANGASTDYVYTWFVTNGSNSLVLSGAAINIIWGSSPPYNLSLSQTNTEGFPCASPTISQPIEPISIMTLNGTNPACQDGLGTYTATNYPDLLYTWQIIPSDAGSVIAGGNSHEVEIQWHSAGVHQVSSTVCGLSASMNVTVNPSPNPSVLADDVCPGATTLAQTTAAFAAYEWRNENGTLIASTPTVNLSDGYYQVIVTDANGCTQNENFYIDEYPRPDVTISTPDFGNFCEQGGSMILYALESSDPLDYQWYFNNSPVGTNSSALTASQEGTYYVVVTDGNGCTGPSNSLNLNCGIFPPSPCAPSGGPSFDILPGNYCNESQYLNTSINDIPNTWSWNFLDVGSGTSSSSSLENPDHTWNTAGFNLVIFGALFPPAIPGGQNCLVGTYSFDTIPLAADFSTLVACYGEATVFTDLSTYIPQTSIAGWSWEFGDPLSGADNTSVDQNPQHIYATSGTYTITLVTTDQSGCISEKQETIVVPDPPISSFNIPLVSCQGATIAFSASGGFTDVVWDFGDPSSGAANQSATASTYHVFDAPGTYTVSLTATNIYDCSETVSQEITIEPNGLTGNIAIAPASSICDGDDAFLTAPAASTYLWSTGEVSQMITVNETGVYDVTVYDADGCAYRPPSVTIDIIPLPVGQINAVQYDEYGQPVEFFYDSYETCYGEDVYLVVTENTNYSYQWTTGEITTDVSFTEEKDNLLEIGTHEISVTIVDLATGCVNEVGPFTVIVHPVPEDIQLISNPAEPICENTSTLISVANPVATYTYIWNNGEVGTSITTFYAGEYFVRAINEFGCSGISNSINITPGPNIDLIPEGCHTRCNPDTICLPFVPDVLSFQWYFNNSPIAAPEGNIPDLVATQSGVYHVEMVSNSGCVAVSDALTLDLYDGYGSVLGEVYFDINNNGMIDGADTLMNNIPIILQNISGTSLDTLYSNASGDFGFTNILSTTYDLIVDEANLPTGFSSVIGLQNAELIGCDDEENVAFLLQFTCPNISSTLDLPTCTGETVDYNGTTLSPGDIQDFILQNVQGCDSTVTVTVPPLMTNVLNLSFQVCPDATADYNGTSLEPGSVTDFIFTNAVGCDSTVSVFVFALSQDSSALPLFVCPGETIMYDGSELAAGTQTDFTYTNQLNCDSIVTVIVEANTTSQEDLNLTACTGSSVFYDGTELFPNSSTDFTYMNVAGCDSTITVNVLELLPNSGTENLNACTGSSVFYDGTELFPNSSTDFTFTNIAGCDSTVTVNVLELQPSSATENLSACTGSSVFYDGTELFPNSSTDFTFTNIVGCDSTVTVNVLELQLSSGTENLGACTGSSVFYDGTELFPNSSTDFTFTNNAGCDSTVTVNVLELQPSIETASLFACTGNSVFYDGTELFPNSSTDFTFTNNAGCDSTVTVNVLELLPSSETESLSACTGSSVFYDGTELFPNSSTDFTFTNIGGCDSTVTVNVLELLPSSETESLSACTNSSVFYDGTELFPNSSTDFTFTNIGGCDSTVTVNVLELLPSSGTESLSACTGTSVFYDGTELFPNSSTDFTFTNNAGCDSTVTVNVLELLSNSETESLSACTGTSVFYDGTELFPNSTTDFTYTNSAGCDSTITVNVLELQLSNETESLSACTGSSVFYDGTELFPNSTTDFTFTNTAGCDSTVTVTVAELFPSTGQEDFETCPGNTIIYDGTALAAGTTTPFVYTNAAGCDSTVTVTVAAFSLADSELELSACTGNFASYNGLQLSAGSITDVVLTDNNGCDSTVTVTVVELQNSITSMFLYACEGETVFYNGEELPAGISMTYDYTNQNNCDSTVNVFVLTYEAGASSLELFACAEETVFFNNVELAVGAEEEMVFSDVNNCDSMVTVSVVAYPEMAFDALGDQTCWNENAGSISVENLSGGLAPFDYSLDGLNYQEETYFESLNGEDYLVYVRDGNGCVKTEWVEVSVIEQMEVRQASNAIPCDYSPVRLEVNVANQENQQLTYLWDNGAGLPFIEVDTPGVYTLQISNDCETITERFEIGMVDDSRDDFFFIPNVFSPNDDLVNDAFEAFPAENVQVLRFEMRVFDRWGNSLYSFRDERDSWDGKLQNQALDEGVYVWYYKATVLSCGRKLDVFKKGDVTIVR